MKRLNNVNTFFKHQSPKNKATFLCMAVIFIYSVYSFVETPSTFLSSFVLGVTVSLLLFSVLQPNKTTKPVTQPLQEKKQSSTEKKTPQEDASFQHSMALLQNLADQLTKDPNTFQTKTAQRPVPPPLTSSVVLGTHEQKAFVIPHMNDHGVIDQQSVMQTERFLKKTGHRVNVLKPKGNYAQAYVTQAQYAKWDSSNSTLAIEFPAHIFNLN